MRAIVFVFAGFLAGAAWAEGTDEPAPESVFIEEDIDDLKQFIWEKRPIIVFADSPNDPNFNQQMEFLHNQADELAERGFGVPPAIALACTAVKSDVTTSKPPVRDCDGQDDCVGFS